MAQTALAKAYRDGNGISQNYGVALKWFRKAADQHNPDAENALGGLYMVGNGVDRDKAEAVRWYRRAAKDGSAAAMYNLGASYYNGDGVDVDDIMSCAWFMLAREAGYPSAQDAVQRANSERPKSSIEASAKIAEMYESGEDLPKSPNNALKWYRIAGDGGIAKASVSAAALLVAEARNLTPEDYSEARRRCEDAAHRLYSPGAYCLAILYGRGVGVAKDPTEAAKWLKRAVELGHGRATLELGEAYWKGEGVKPDRITAYMYIWIAEVSKIDGAYRDETALRAEMSAKDIEKAKQKAHTWAVEHRLFGLPQSWVSH